jgi:hypothetical protein
LDNGDSSDESDDFGESEDPHGDKIKRKYKPDLEKLKTQFIDSIGNIQPKTEKLGQEQQNDIIRKFNSEMIKMKKKLEE